ncbi:MAG: peptidoglycan DL-endopeptidase CwlO [Actinomycetota bacterium]|nr:peptidoglycan DL-endopeptidase CwlO [Actinomycetota bacterium]
MSLRENVAGVLRRALAVALVCAVSGVLAAGPAAADEPTIGQLQAQQRRVAGLERLADAQVAGTRSAAQRLTALAQEAARSLQAYVTIRDEAFQARAEESAQRHAYDDARALAEQKHSDLGRFASSAYRNGGGAGELATIASLLDATSVTDMGRGAADLAWAGEQQSRTLDRVQLAEAQAATAAAAAAAAKERAEDAERRGRIAKETADALVAAQQSLVAALAQQARTTKDAARQAAAEAARMVQARAVAAQRRAEAARARQAALRRGEAVRFNAAAAGSGACQGGDISSYPNGEIPREMLCPLWGADWQVLRADAAATFSAMSKAYAARFGRPICVTDSYRSLEMQIDVHRRKPTMTAEPGTSNHGWGTAVDLCDGIQSFGTVTYQWMQANASRFGWFHPGWAEPGTSRPEPWHWEFGG